MVGVWWGVSPNVGMAWGFGGGLVGFGGGLVGVIETEQEQCQ